MQRYKLEILAKSEVIIEADKKDFTSVDAEDLIKKYGLNVCGGGDYYWNISSLQKIKLEKVISIEQER